MAAPSRLPEEELLALLSATRTQIAGVGGVVAKFGLAVAVQTAGPTEALELVERLEVMPTPTDFDALPAGGKNANGFNVYCAVVELVWATELVAQIVYPVLSNVLAQPDVPNVPDMLPRGIGPSSAPTGSVAFAGSKFSAGCATQDTPVIAPEAACSAQIKWPVPLFEGAQLIEPVLAGVLSGWLYSPEWIVLVCADVRSAKAVCSTNPQSSRDIQPCTRNMLTRLIKYSLSSVVRMLVAFVEKIGQLPRSSHTKSGRLMFYT